LGEERQNKLSTGGIQEERKERWRTGKVKKRGEVKKRRK